MRRPCPITIVFILTLLSLPVFPDTCGAMVSELDREGVFCAYWYVNGEEPGDADIEDLHWCLERPLFSKFKPAEMFSKKSLNLIRNNLRQKIKGFKGEPLFRWRMEGEFEKKAKGMVSFSTSLDRKSLPEATPHIQSEVSREGWGSLVKALKKLPLSMPGGRGPARQEIGVLLRPVSVYDRSERRNIALEDVVIPIHCIVFVPVAIEPPSNWGPAQLSLTH